MRGRALTFADPQLAKLASDAFVAVVADEWVERRRQDAEGEFFRHVTDQAPAPAKGQGVYCFTASGKLLAFSRSHNAKNVRRLLHGAVESFGALSAEQRTAAVPERFAPDPQWDAPPPPDALILRAYARTLEGDGGGGYRPCSKLPTSHGQAAARDHAWLKAEEWRSLIPPAPQLGDLAEFPRLVLRRLCCFHLTDYTRGEPPMWRRKEVRRATLRTRVTRATQDVIELALEGDVLLATQPDAARAERGFEARISGEIAIDRPDRLTRFDMVAIGDHWGEWQWSSGARPGRAPLGIAFELVPGRAPGDLVPPHAARDRATYFS